MILPEDFIRQTKRIMGEEMWRKLTLGLAQEPPVSIRMNPRKCGSGGCEPADADGMVAWCEDGYYLSTRPNFTFDPLFHAGLYYVQEAASMFIDRVLRQHLGKEPIMALDLCAAPGGKSTVARGVLPEGSLLVCNEPIRNRAWILAENIMKYGDPDVIVTNNYPRDIRRSGMTFDLIIADVPCSGEGMFRKDPAAVDEWSLQNVEKCWQLQREIIADAWECLRPGGLLVYSTCTFNTKEDEENVRHICETYGAEVLGVTTDDSMQISGSLLDGYTEPVYRFIPGISRGEGLFIAVMRKGEDGIYNKVKTKDRKERKQRQKDNGKDNTRRTLAWLKRQDDFELAVNGDTVTAVPKAWKNVYDTAQNALNVLSAGVMLGEVKGKDIVPSQALALSTALDSTKFPSVELDYGQSLAYLRKEAVTLPADTPRGYVLMKYRGVPLGFEKNIGNRANNLYPAEWRIKSTHTPEGNNEVIKLKQQ